VVGPGTDVPAGRRTAAADLDRLRTELGPRLGA
jgi:hypothetical protein